MMAHGSFVRTKTVYQMEATECGAACLCMIMEFWGHHVPLEQMRVDTGVSRDGCLAGNIMRAAMTYGMETHGYRKNPDALRTMQMPCIIHWNNNHFVVLEGFKGKKVFINDPALGRYGVTQEDFVHNYSGIVITFKPGKTFEKKAGERRVLSSILDRFYENRIDIVRLLLSGLIMLAPGFVLPFLTGMFIDRKWSDAFRPFGALFIIAFLVTILIGAVLEWYRNSVILRVQSKLILKSSRSFLGHLFRLSISFFEQRYAADLASRVSDNDSVNLFMTGTLSTVILDLVTSLIFLTSLIFINPYMTLAAVVCLMVDLVSANLISRRISDLTIKYKQDYSTLTGVTTAGVKISSTLKAAGAEHIYVSGLQGLYNNVCTDEQQINKHLVSSSVISEITDNVALICIIAIGVNEIINNRISVGMLITFLMMYRLLISPLKAIVETLKHIQELCVDVERSNDIMIHPMSDTYDTEQSNDYVKEKLSGEISFKNITFRYNHLSAPIIENINFDVNCGDSIAFVGPSGSGKSTITKLLSGLYRPDNGQITFDGVDVKDINLEVFHASVSTVSQKISMFSGTIRDNLTMWNPAVLEQDMINAAKDACIHEEIMKRKGGYDSILAENAVNMSGGQRQRLEIARALVTNPTILVMDEATSALDPIVEKQIIDNIKRRGCTCIMVAHRLSAVRDCNRIVVVHNGHIVQTGTHEELAGEEGMYKKLMSIETV